MCGHKTALLSITGKTWKNEGKNGPFWGSPWISKVHPRRGHEGPEEEQKYSSTLSLTSALDGGGWLTPRPGRFTPEKETRYLLYRRLGGPQGRCGRVRKISPQRDFFFSSLFVLYP
jgi:hypothetical protein